MSYHAEQDATVRELVADHAEFALGLALRELESQDPARLEAVLASHGYHKTTPEWVTPRTAPGASYLAALKQAKEGA